jgi:hypothetical protein
MSRLNLALLAVATIVLACYKDDSGPAGLPNGKPMTKVLLTDDPFPFDTVQSVNVYIVSIAASTAADTSDPGLQWVTITAPRKRFDLLALQQGTTALLGEGEIPADQYRSVRLIIDADSSNVRFADGTPAVVQNWNGSGEWSIYAFVEAALQVPDSGAEIVIDFDVGRSFQYNVAGDGTFTFIPWIRAVNKAATGSIAGTVQGAADSGSAAPIANATVSAYGADQGTWRIFSTARTDGVGHYRLAYLLPGTYIVGVDPPSGSPLGSALDSNVVVIRGVETTHNVTLSAFQGAVLIQGASSMLVGRTNPLEAIVVNAQHEQDPDAPVAWQNLDTNVLGLVVDSVRFARVTSKIVGTGRIVATSGALADTLVIQVAPDTSSSPSPHR